MKWLVRLTLLVLLTSCSAQWHLKRAVRLDPFILEKDTLVVTDTVVLPAVAITDTVTTKQHDTIIIEKERLKVKIIKRLDTLIIDAKCDSDTIIRTIEVPYEKIIYKEKESLFDKIQKLTLLFILVAIVLLAVKKLISRYLDI